MTALISPLDPDEDGPLFAAALTLEHAVVAERDPDLDPDTADGFRKSLGGNDTFEEYVAVAMEADIAVGILRASFHHLEANSEKAEITIDVHPGHRRHGHGTALLRHVIELCEAKGRTGIVAFGPDTEESESFWGSFGMTKGMVERESRLWLADTDEQMMLDWVARRHQRASDYVLHHYVGRTPDHLLDAAVIGTNAMNDAPTEDLDWDDDNWTREEVLELDDFLADLGRERWVTIAMDATGDTAGMTGISIQKDKPRFAFQGNTAVLAHHRNKGIGRWLKADMWLRLRNDAPFVEAINTDNAESNDPMLAINIAMGFKPQMAWGAWQGQTGDIFAT